MGLARALTLLLTLHSVTGAEPAAVGAGLTEGQPLAEAAMPAFPRWGLRAFVGGSLDRGGFDAGIGAHRALSSRLTLGADFEFSPWFDLIALAVAPGVANGYGTLRWAWITLPQFALRSTAHLGTSVLLFKAVGAPAGSVGAFAGLALLDVALRLSPSLWLELTPEVTLSAPLLRATPLVYRQYRLNIGLLHWL